MDIDDHRRGLERRPPGVSDAAVEAAGKVSEAIEWVERARGRLYDFHQMSGHADLCLSDAVELLHQSGRPELAERLRRELIGRNVIHGRWTFQIVEEYDDTYWGPLRAFGTEVERQLTGGARHVYEAEMKARRISRGAPHQEPQPQPGGGSG
jgi:hypothetical protein